MGLFSHLYKVEQSELDLLGAEVVALSHGSPLAFLSGAALAHIISRSLSAPDLPLKNLVLEAAQSLKNQFGHQYSQSFEISNLLNLAVSLAEDSRLNPVTAMEQLHCLNAAQVLSGAVYACLRCGKSFDTAMIAAVNHSGRSAAVGAVAGAILGLRLGKRPCPASTSSAWSPPRPWGSWPRICWAAAPWSGAASSSTWTGTGNISTAENKNSAAWRRISPLQFA